MSLFRTVRAVAGASGDDVVDWGSVAEAAKAATAPGDLSLTEHERDGYAADVRDARTAISNASGRSFTVPPVLEIQNRHHWIDANIETFERVMAPLADNTGPMPGVTRTINTGTLTVLLSFLGRHVLGQYDPLLLAEAPDEDHALYFVHPNIEQTARALEVDTDRFRRWIAFHEVTHAAEFGAAPWLSDHLEAQMQTGVTALANGSFDREAFAALDTTMTVVEGYAELLMDHAFDEAYSDLREKVDARRSARGPLQRLVRRLLGLDVKRRQYERGRAFFDCVADERGLEAAGSVWEGPDQLPTGEEIDHPRQWLRRVDP